MAADIAKQQGKEKGFMMYFVRRVFLRFVQLAALAALALSVPAFAQFEVSPDHFDSAPAPEKKQAVKSTATKARSQSAALTANANKQQTQGAGQAVIARKTSNGSASRRKQDQATASIASRKSQAPGPKKRVAPEKVAVASNR